MVGGAETSIIAALPALARPLDENAARAELSFGRSDLQPRRSVRAAATMWALRTQPHR